VIVDDAAERYAEAHSTPEPGLLARVAGVTRDRFADRSGMMVGHLEGAFLAMLVAVAQPRHVLEIGTFTGYSSLAMAAALPPGGRITTCDISAEHVALARDHVAMSPHADRIDIRLGPALETLDGLEGPFDLVFIDADKTGYDAYYEAVLPKLADDGLVVVDNVLWRGQVLTDEAQDPDSVALRAFNDKVAADERVHAVMLTVRDGMTLVRKRA
jgi:caffeoyl-CoA O-methyltransferase